MPPSNFIFTACKRSLGQGNYLYPRVILFTGGSSAPSGVEVPPRYGIWSTSRRYASYCNAFLSCSFLAKFCHIINWRQPVWEVLDPPLPAPVTILFMIHHRQLRNNYYIYIKPQIIPALLHNNHRGLCMDPCKMSLE